VLAGEGEDAAAAAKVDAASPAKPETPKAEAPKAPQAPKAEPAAPASQAAPAARPAAPNGAAAPAEGRAFASPLARRLAKDAGMDISAIAGSGPRGRVIKADVEAAIAGGGAKAAPAPKAGDVASPAP